MITKERDIYETCVLDFEFSTHGGRVVPISYVARVQDDHPLDHKAYWQQVWMPEKGSTPPYSVGDDNVVIDSGSDDDEPEPEPEPVKKKRGGRRKKTSS